MSSSHIFDPQVVTKMKINLLICVLALIIFSCKSEDYPPVPVSEQFYLYQIKVAGQAGGFDFYNVNTFPDIQIIFSVAIDPFSAEQNIRLLNGTTVVPVNLVFTTTHDSIVTISPVGSLNKETKYTIQVLPELLSKKQTKLNSAITAAVVTELDSSTKFPLITDEELLTLIQKQTFRYFYDFAHPSSGMARERNTSGDIVTTGGTGFGIMALIVGMQRGFISRTEGISHLTKILNFLSTCDRFHGAWPHWINGVTGKVAPFSTRDNGGDLVETSFMTAGLITMRQYLNISDPVEETLIHKINNLVNSVEYDWYTQNQQVLYWHWSPDYGWAINMKLQGNNETLLAYIMAASSTAHTISRDVYKNGYARNGEIRNGKQFYGITLPLGEDYGGPLFFTHYSFLGLDPRNLKDEYADYWEQNVNHSKINYAYCVTNPRNRFGYGQDCWGLTASDIPKGYTASSPTNDVGVIAPTAAISSLPYTPDESMKAIRFYYYILGNHLWKSHGFIDAFSLSDMWFANSFLAIDQGPQICMIENYRTGLLWNLFMSAPEVQSGLTKLGFSYK